VRHDNSKKKLDFDNNSYLESRIRENNSDIKQIHITEENE